ncbi:MAG: extracellular solute-binding protein [Rhodobacteraceae bacterium]|nr:extracellular solute-binding protein [Paracoccaceae bacterium]
MTHKNLTRRTMLSTGVAAGAMALAAPQIANAQAVTLNVTGWGGKWGDEFDKNLTAMFEAETGGKLQRDTSFPFLPKLQASSRRDPIYDVLHTNNNEQWAASEMGLIEPEVPSDQVPNMGDLYDYAKSDKVAGVVMFTSAIGIGYRKDLVSAPPTSWTDMWLDEYANRRGAYVISVNSLGQAFLTMTASIYGSGPDDLEAAYAALEKLKPVKLVDFTGSMEKMLLGGEVALGIIHDSGVLRNLEANPDLEFASPNEGVLALEQVLSVTAGSQKKELAYAYIDFMLRPDVQKTMAEAVWYSPANSKVVLADQYQERLLTTPEKVATLVQVDWKWYNANKDAIDARVARIFRA